MAISLKRAFLQFFGTGVNFAISKVLILSVLTAYVYFMHGTLTLEVRHPHGVQGGPYKIIKINSTHVENVALYNIFQHIIMTSAKISNAIAGGRRDVLQQFSQGERLC